MGRRVDGSIGRWVDGSMGRKGSQTTNKNRPQGRNNRQNGRPKGPRASLWHPKGIFFGALGAPGGHFGHPKCHIFMAREPWEDTLNTQGGDWGEQPAKKCQAQSPPSTLGAKRCQNGSPRGSFWGFFRRLKKQTISRLAPKVDFYRFRSRFYSKRKKERHDSQKSLFCCNKADVFEMWTASKPRKTSQETGFKSSYIL